MDTLFVIDSPIKVLFNQGPQLGLKVASTFLVVYTPYVRNTEAGVIIYYTDLKAKSLTYHKVRNEPRDRTIGEPRPAICLPLRVRCPLLLLLLNV